MVIKMKRFILTLVLSFNILFIFTSSASAYALLPSWQSWGKDVQWSKDTYYYLSYDAPIQAAMNSWNNTPTKANIYYKAGTWCDISTRSLPNDTWYGAYTRGIGYYTVTLNDYRISQDYSSANKPKVIQSVMAHEWGHALGLADIPTGTTMLMGHARDRTSIITPQQDDINGVNAIYRQP
jgi:hypothetical protein